jgi:hypothetical protein
MSSFFDIKGTFTLMSKLLETSKSFILDPKLVVPIIKSLLSFLFGIFFTRTRIAYNIELENLGPISTYSISLSMLSRIIQDRSDL